MAGRKTIEPRPIGDALELPRRVQPWYVVTAVATLAVLVVVSIFLAPPSTVGHITVDNPTRYDLAIAVAGRDGEGTMAVGNARRDTSSTFREVVDQGDTWIFHFSAQGQDGGELEVTRADLERAGWQLEVPPSVSDTLYAKGAEFPP